MVSELVVPEGRAPLATGSPAHLWRFRGSSCSILTFYRGCLRPASSEVISSHRVLFSSNFYLHDICGFNMPSNHFSPETLRCHFASLLRRLPKGMVLRLTSSNLVLSTDVWEQSAGEHLVPGNIFIPHKKCAWGRHWGKYTINILLFCLDFPVYLSPCKVWFLDIAGKQSW